jgi:hypothetical protein
MMAYHISLKRLGIELTADTADEFKQQMDLVLDKGEAFDAFVQEHRGLRQLSGTAKQFLRIMGPGAPGDYPRLTSAEIVGALGPGMKGPRGIGPMVGAIRRHLEDIAPGIPFDQVLQRHKDDGGQIYWSGGPRLAEVLDLLEG